MAMRIGAVKYLNTKPLVYGLAEAVPQHELVFDLPSRLADQLAAGRLDVALIPSIEFFQHPHYEIVSDACIACSGPVRSVKLFSRVPLEAIRTLALDEGSRTSAALVQILLRERFGLAPRLLPFPIDTQPQRIAADALLMIGDRAMHPPVGEYASEWDLGDVWCNWSELPFVFAMWVGRRESGARSRESADEFAELSHLLSRVRDAGMANVEQIAAAEHEGVGLSYDDCLRYLRDHLHFYFGPREQSGLRLFHEYATRLGLGRPVAALSLAGTKSGPGAQPTFANFVNTGTRFGPS
jgi:chorismate dehydratase